MSSMKMSMTFNRNTIISRSSVPQVQKTLDVPVVQNKPAASTERKGVKSLLSLGGIMHLSTNCTPCKACGS
jgi:hypothetical protein